jgi:hypothetical protein
MGRFNRTSRRSIRAWALVLVVLPTVTPGQQDTSGAKASALDEVVITAKGLRELRDDVIEAEDRVYALYNELNKDEQFDIVCHQAVRTGMVMSERVCRPKLVEAATSEEARGFLEAVQANEQLRDAPDAGQLYRSRGPNANLVIASKKAQYTENVLRLLRESPRLRELASERDAAQNRYEKARKEHFTRHGKE